MKSDRASVVVETLFVVPVVMMVLLLTVYAGQMTETSIQLRAVAATASRRASQASRDSMSKVAERAVREGLGERGVPCAAWRAHVAVVGAFDAVQVSVTIQCRLKTTILGTLPLPTQVISVDSNSPVDRYRGQ